MLVSLDSVELENEIPGALEAKQARSLRLRDHYIREGIRCLNKQRLNQLRISDLAKACGSSVGSFYTRFQDKESYFLSLRSATVEICNQEAHYRVNVEKLYSMSGAQALDEMVDLMADIFTSAVRGVLRESLLRILEPDDPWAPMRDGARSIMRNYEVACAMMFPNFSPKEAKVRLRYCFQLVVGALQNDLVNDYHVFSTKDQTLRTALKETVRLYMGEATKDVG